MGNGSLNISHSVSFIVSIWMVCWLACNSARSLLDTLTAGSICNSKYKAYADESSNGLGSGCTRKPRMKTIFTVLESHSSHFHFWTVHVERI